MNNSSTTGVCWTDKMTDVQRGQMCREATSLHDLKMSKEDLWRTVLQSSLISLSTDNCYIDSYLQVDCIRAETQY
jgi:hypothetical protein